MTNFTIIFFQKRDIFRLNELQKTNIILKHNMSAMIENKQQVGMTAAFSRIENKPKYSKSTYVPPHQRNKPTQKSSFDQKFTNGGNKKSLDYNNSYKPRGSTFSFLG